MRKIEQTYPSTAKDVHNLTMISTISLSFSIMRLFGFEGGAEARGKRYLSSSPCATPTSSAESLKNLLTLKLPQ